MTAGAGSLNYQVYDALSPLNLTVSGGTCAMVGLGGYMSGGGYGFNSRAFGLGVDNIVSARVLLANGEIVYANKTNDYSDLLWAIRGGGGNTYGTILEYTIRAYELSKVIRVNWHESCNVTIGEC